MREIGKERGRMAGKIKRPFLILAKICVSAFILWILFRTIDLRQVINAVCQTNPSYIVVAVLCSAAGTLLGVYRWKIALAVQCIWVPFKMVLSLTLVSGFLGFVLPSSIASDGIKGYEMFRYNKQGINIIASIFFERICGLISLIVVGIISIIIGLEAIKNMPLLWSIIFLYSIISLLIILCFNTKITKKMLSIMGSETKLALIRNKFESLVTAIYLYRINLRAWFAVIGLSLLFQFIGVLYYYVISLSLGLPIPFKIFFIIIPMVTLFTLVPISPGGLGVKEGLFVVLFREFGVSPEAALLLSLLGTSLYLIFVIIGAIIYTGRSLLSKTIE